MGDKQDLKNDRAYLSESEVAWFIGVKLRELKRRIKMEDFPPPEKVEDGIGYWKLGKIGLPCYLCAAVKDLALVSQAPDGVSSATWLHSSDPVLTVLVEAVGKLVHPSLTAETATARTARLLQERLAEFEEVGHE
jgi:hypothetical protein